MVSRWHKPIISPMRQKTTVNTSVVDPVCWMDVASTSAAGRSEYKGTTYFFCSMGCKEAFDREPARYIEDGLDEPIYQAEKITVKDS